MASPLNRKLLLSVTTSPFPFLYQTRTLSPWSTSLRKSIPCRFNHYDSRYFRELRANSTENEQADPDDQPQQESQNAPSSISAQRPRRTSYLQRKAKARAAAAPTPTPPPPEIKPEYKLTERERKAFGGLIGRFSPEENYEGPQSRPALQPRDSSIESDTSQYLKVLGEALATPTLSANYSNPRNEAQDPVSTVIGKDEPASFLEDQTETQEDIEAESPDEGDSEYILEPSDKAPLHTIRLKDIVSANEEWDDKWENPLLTERHAINMVIRREVTKITDKLLTTIQEEKGDAGVWDVCTNQVFSIVHSLDETIDSSKQATSTGIEIPSILPTEVVISELYPKLLLQVFRMLATYFPDSPILGQFRTAMKAQGQASTFFAVSPALYDEMILFSWDHAKDLNGVVSLLHDMHNAGLDASPTVHQLLRGIVRERKYEMEDVADGERHEFWDTPSNRAAFEEIAGPVGWVERTKFQSDRKLSRDRLPLPRFRR